MTPMDAPIWMLPRISQSAVRVCVAVHVGAVCACLWAWPWTPSLLVAAALIAAAGRAVVHELTAVPREFSAVLLAPDGTWWLTDSAGDRLFATIDGAPLVCALFVVVPLRTRVGRYTWLASRDCVPAATLRRLRVRLRFAPAGSATVSAAG